MSIYKSFLCTCAVAVLLFAFTSRSRHGGEIGKRSAAPKAITGTPRNEPTAKKAAGSSVREEQFARNVFRALQKGNLAGWLALHPNDLLVQLNELKVKYADKPLLLGKKINELVADMSTKAPVEKHSQLFQELQQRAGKAGLQWDAASFSEFIFETSKTQNGADSLNGDIWLKIKDTEFVIEGLEAISVGGTYCLQCITDIKRIDPNE